MITFPSLIYRGEEVGEGGGWGVNHIDRKKFMTLGYANENLNSFKDQNLYIFHESMKLNDRHRYIVNLSNS